MRASALLEGGRRSKGQGAGRRSRCWQWEGGWPCSSGGVQGTVPALPPQRAALRLALAWRPALEGAHFAWVTTSIREVWLRMQVWRARVVLRWRLVAFRTRLRAPWPVALAQALRWAVPMLLMTWTKLGVAMLVMGLGRQGAVLPKRVWRLLPVWEAAWLWMALWLLKGGCLWHAAPPVLPEGPGPAALLGKVLALPSTPLPAWPPAMLGRLLLPVIRALGVRRRFTPLLPWLLALLP